MVLDVPVHRGDLHELVRINLAEPLDVHLPAFPVDAMVALVPENIIKHTEFKVLAVIIRIIIHQEQTKNQGMFDNL
jgi:hypothetical protein